jgi:hypothetical protein
MFQVQQAEKPFNIQVEHGECSASCLDAKEIKCICRCGGQNHGAALRKNVKSLDEFNDCSNRSQETYEDPVDQTFSPEEYLEEMVLA